MLLIRKKRPTLTTQNDSIPAKLFISFFFSLFCFKYSRLVYSNVFSHLLFSIQRSLSYYNLHAFDNGDMSSPKRHLFILLLFYSETNSFPGLFPLKLGGAVPPNFKGKSPGN